MSDRRERLIWTDLEMTGLDPEKDSILQLAMAVTELGSFEVLDTLEVVIWQPESRLELMSPFVRKMHESSGLTSRVRASQSSEMDAERAALDLVAKWCGPRQAILAGNSIWQDRRFLTKYMPVLEGTLHFRMVDVTAFKIMARAWCGERGSFKKDKAHTAMEDVRASLEELAFYRKLFGA